ncbi:MAG TPA: type II toxin-antitoxin system ParD family antitoxin [Devosia sp.]|uniref:ribbon-helix-helix domain-containing protein n=1 Tax=Devosia sp. TaxID=1871048 RepID=UPI002F9406BE
MATMDISLPDKMKQWIEEQVAAGHYSDISEYMVGLVREDQRTYARQKLQDMVDQALASGINQKSKEELLEQIMSRAIAAVEARKSA